MSSTSPAEGSWSEYAVIPELTSPMHLNIGFPRQDAGKTLPWEVTVSSFTLRPDGAEMYLGSRNDKLYAETPKLYEPSDSRRIIRVQSISAASGTTHQVTIPPGHKAFVEYWPLTQGVTCTFVRSAPALSEENMSTLSHPKSAYRSIWVQDIRRPPKPSQSTQVGFLQVPESAATSSGASQRPRARSAGEFEANWDAASRSWGDVRRQEVRTGARSASHSPEPRNRVNLVSDEESRVWLDPSLENWEVAQAAWKNVEASEAQAGARSGGNSPQP